MNIAGTAIEIGLAVAAVFTGGATAVLLGLASGAVGLGMAAYNFEIAEDVMDAAAAGRGGTYQFADIDEASINMFFATIDLFLSAIDFVLAAKNGLELMDNIHLLKRDLGIIVVDDTVEFTDDFLNAANQPYKSGQFTVSGRALTKHPNIVGADNAQDLYKMFGNQNGINQAAYNAIQNFKTNGVSITKTHSVFGEIIDFRLPNGLGVRFNATTKEFIHFLGRGV